MDKVKVVVKDQLDQEYVVTAYLNELDDEDLSIFKRIDHLVVNDEVILPNVDLLYESQQDEKIYKVSALVEE